MKQKDETTLLNFFFRIIYSETTDFSKTTLFKFFYSEILFFFNYNLNRLQMFSTKSSNGK